MKTAAGKMKVKLGPKSFKVVASYKEASEAVLHDIRTAHGIYGIGSQKWYALGAGNIYVDGVPVAHVSYNGRVWKGPGPGKAGDEEIPL